MQVFIQSLEALSQWKTIICACALQCGEKWNDKNRAFPAGGLAGGRDVFCLCRRPVSTLLHRLGIRDTGISPINKQDVDGYFDDWHLFRLGQNPRVCGLAKLRSRSTTFPRLQTGMTGDFHFFCGLSPGNAGSAVSRGYPRQSRYGTLCGCLPGRNGAVFSRPHDPQLQRYFSNPASLGSYAIANAYVGEKILSLFPMDASPLPDRFLLKPRRLLAGLEQLGGDLYCPGENA